MADDIYGVEIEELADVVIASCGGYPKDINVYQAHKTLSNAMEALKQGGRIILLARCSEGIGSEAYERWAVKILSNRLFITQDMPQVVLLQAFSNLVSKKNGQGRFCQIQG